MTLQTRVSLASVVTSLAAVGAWLALPTHPDTTGPLGLALAAVVTLGIATGVAGVLAWHVVHQLRHRMEALDQRVRVSLTDAASSPPPDLAADELGRLARSLDEATRSHADRLRSLTRDQTRAAAVLAAMHEGVLVTDHHGGVQLVNDAARAMLQLDDDSRGRHYLELVREPTVASAIASGIGGTSAEVGEITPTREPDRRLLVHVHAIRSDQAAGAVLLLHDVTALRQADVVRRDFVANVSHELRTPLTAIRGYVEALRDTEPTPDESRRFLGIIARHTGRMERLVDDLLRLARLEAGQETLDVSDGQMHSLIADVISDLSPAIDARRQRTAIRIRPDASTVRTDCQKLQDVLRNLVENAVNYGPEGGTISVTADRVEDDLTITVADQGQGLPAGDRQRVFERFYRGTKNRADAPPGTGLGLSIVKHLMELIGGRVHADNGVNGGALFTVTLPRSTPVLGRDEDPSAGRTPTATEQRASGPAPTRQPSARTVRPHR